MKQNALNKKSNFLKIAQLGIGQKIYVVMALLVGIALTMAVSTYMLISEITITTQRLAQHDLPQMINSGSLDRESAALALNARFLVHAETKEDVEKIIATISKILSTMEQLVKNLDLSKDEHSVFSEEIEHISKIIPKLADNTKNRLSILQDIGQKMQKAKKIHDDLIKDTAPFYDDVESNLMISIGNITNLGKIIKLDDAKKIKKLVMMQNNQDKGVNIKNTPTIDMKKSGKDLEINVTTLSNALKYIADINLLSGYYNTAEKLGNKEKLMSLKNLYTATENKIKTAVKTIDSEDLQSHTLDFLALGTGNKNIFSLRESYLIDTTSAEKMSNELLLVLNSMQDNVTKQTSLIQDSAKNSGSNAIERSENIHIVIIGASLLLLLVSTSISVLYVRPVIVKRVLAIYDATTRIAAGDLETPIEKTGNDELTKISEALVTFKDNIIENKKLEEAQKATKQEQEEARKATMLMMAEQFEIQIGQIVEMVAGRAQEMQEMTNTLSTTIQETSTRSDAVVHAANQASANVQTVAAGAEEMSASIKEISVNVTDTVGTAKECTVAAKKSQSKLDELRHAIEEIDAVIQSINDVAEQTNLLALNATIEAARAGDAGKGFAVVANEVKALANQTHNMTEEISNKVNHVKESARDTISTVDNILLQITSVDEKTTNVAAAIEEQNATTIEISRSIQEAAQGTDSVSKNIQDIQQSATESTSSTEQLKTASSELSEQTKNLQASVKEFLTEIRTA
ncbi:MAG: hypothetical protein COB14_03660 [Alphaproteobacteria bacterium]|nr:MAG: hypothetical protein COB14_03660 [Alphaproteobacteria bacterium]